MRNIFLLLLLVNSASFSCGQSFKYKEIPSSLRASTIPSILERNEIKKGFSNAFNIVSILPRNYVKDGTVDYTKVVQFALDTYDKVIFPDFPILVNSEGLTIRSNSKIYFPSNSKIILKANDKKIYEIIRIHQVKNVYIYFPNIIGDRKTHIDKGGEWGMGISIRDAENVVIDKPQVADCWGDGIYIDKISDISKNITINYPYLNNNRRNGISVISVDGLRIYSPVIANTNGTSPMAGIDFEPDLNDESLKNIVIDHPITYNNHDHGILFALSNLSGKLKQVVDIEIDNYTDFYSAYGISLKLSQDPSAIFKPSGSIIINNPILKYNALKPVLLYSGNLLNTINVGISNLHVVDYKYPTNASIYYDKLRLDLKENSKNVLLK